MRPFTREGVFKSKNEIVKCYYVEATPGATEPAVGKCIIDFQFLIAFIILNVTEIKIAFDVDCYWKVFELLEGNQWRIPFSVENPFLQG